MKRYLFLIIILININVNAQNYTYSNFLNSTNNTNIYNVEKVSDGFLAFGHYRGTLDIPGSPVANGFDIYLIKYDNNFEFQWMEQIGGLLIDFAFDLKVASDGSIYLIGSFTGDCLFDGANTITADGSLYDVMVAKYNSDGTFVWGNKIASNDGDQIGTSLDIDKNGDIIIGGYYSDSITFSNNDCYTETYGLFYAKLDDLGNVTWSKSISSTESDSQIQSLSAFDDGYYFNGSINGTVGFDLGDETANNASFTDVFIYKTDFSGNGTWVRRTYGDGNALSGSISDDDYGNIYFTGYYAGTQLEFDENATTKSSTVLGNNGSLDIFVLSYNKQGNSNWANNYGQSGEEFARDLKFQNDFLYITGYYSDSLIFGNDTILSSGAADIDAFLGMIDKDGNTLKVEATGDSDDGTDSGMALSTDAENNVFWGGYFSSTSTTIGDSIYINPNPGKKCVFVSKYKPPYIAAFTKKINVSCNSGSDGELIVTPYFGVLPYTYSWSHNGTLNDSTATGLSAGIYTVTVTDAIDSTDVAQYTLTEPDEFIFNPIITDVTTCSYNTNGAIDLNVTGGNGGNGYQWEGYGTDNVEDQTGLATGTYNVTVTDDELCTGDTTIVILGPEPVTFDNSAVTHYTGSDPSTGKVNLELIGGTGTPSAYAASWTGPSSYTASVQDIESLAAGNYTVTVTDASACDFDTTFAVLDHDNLYAYISSSKDACNGTTDGKATVSYYNPDASPDDITYSWNDPSSQTTATATNLAHGRYYVVTITDISSSETSKDSVYINELAYVFSGSLSGTTVLDCKGDTDGTIDLSITTAGTPPYLYSWSNSATTQDISSLVANTYSVTVIDDNECTFSITGYSITEPEFDLAASASIVTEPLCNGEYNGEIRVDANGGNNAPYTYLWDDPGSQTSQIANGLDAGFYNVAATDFKGCTATASVNLTEPEILTLSGAITHLNCFGDNNGVIDITVGGGTPTYSYSWTTLDGSGLAPVAGDQSGLTSGTYNLTVTDGNSCEISDIYTVTEPVELIIDTESKTDITTCNGDNSGTITITASGGTGSLQYSIDDGATYQATGNFTSLTASTNYIVKVKDANGCEIAGTTLTISEPTAISITSEIPTNISCNGTADGQIVIVATGGTGSLEYSIDDGTIYQATGTFADLTAGTNYQVKVKDDNACEVIGSTLTITEPTAIIISSETETNISCNGAADGQIVIVATGGTGSLQYSIDDGTNYQGSGTFTGLTAGTNYQVKVIDDNSCEVTGSTLTISEPTAISISSETVTDISCNGTADGQIVIVATGGTGSLEYSIDDGTIYQATGTFADLTAGTNYIVKVKDENACEIIGSTLTITEPTAIIISSETVTDISCNGSADGQIVIIATGGTGSLEYSIDDGTIYQATGDFTSLTASTNYIVKVKDDNACELTGSTLTITEPTVISIDTESSTDATSQTATDGSVTVEASGGTGILSYTLTPGDVINETGIYTGLTPNDYIVNITDENFCGPVASNTITVGFIDAIDDISKSDLVKLYPNPTSDKLNIEIDIEETGSFKIEILTISGQLVFQKEVEFSGKLVDELDLSMYSKGIYIIRVTGNAIYYKEKILLQ